MQFFIFYQPILIQKHKSILQYFNLFFLYFSERKSTTVVIMTKNTTLRVCVLIVTTSTEGQKSRGSARILNCMLAGFAKTATSINIIK